MRLTTPPIVALRSSGYRRVTERKNVRNVAGAITLIGNTLWLPDSQPVSVINLPAAGQGSTPPR